MSYRRLVDEVRRAYPDDKRRGERADDLPSFFVYRPLSFWLTPPFVACGVSASGVTLASIGLALAMPAAAWIGGAPLVAAVALLVQILDSVDGNIARVTGSASPVGQFLDGLATVTFWAAYFVAVGVATEAASTGVVGRHGLEIGLGLAVLYLWQRGIEDSHAVAFDVRVRWEPPAVATRGGTFAGLGRAVEHLYVMPGFVIAGVVGALDAFLTVIAAYQVTLLCLWLVRFAAALRAQR